MRLPILFAIALFAQRICGHAQTIKKADSLSPEDLEARKYVFEITPQGEEVAVFRQDEYEDGKLSRRIETFSGAIKPREVCTQSVSLVDGSYFQSFTTDGKVGPGPYRLRAPGGTERFEHCELRGTARSDKTIEMWFVGIPGEAIEDQKEVFSLFVEPYSALQKRYPDLPPLEEFRGRRIEYNGVTHPEATSSK